MENAVLYILATIGVLILGLGLILLKIRSLLKKEKEALGRSLKTKRNIKMLFEVITEEENAKIPLSRAIKTTQFLADEDGKMLVTNYVMEYDDWTILGSMIKRDGKWQYGFRLDRITLWSDSASARRSPLTPELKWIKDTLDSLGISYQEYPSNNTMH